MQLCLSFKLDVLTTSPTTERNIDHELLSASLILLYSYVPKPYNVDSIKLTITIHICMYTVESFLTDTPNKGHCIIYLSTMDKTKSLNFNPPINIMQLESLIKGQSLYSGQTTCIYIGPKVSFIRRLHCIYKYSVDITYCV